MLWLNRPEADSTDSRKKVYAYQELGNKDPSQLCDDKVLTTFGMDVVRNMLNSRREFIWVCNNLFIASSVQQGPPICKQVYRGGVEAE